MKFYCIWQYFIFLTVIWLIDAKSTVSDDQSQIEKKVADYTVHHHNYAKDQEIIATDMDLQASEVQHLELRARRGNRKQQQQQQKRNIILLRPQRKRGFGRYESPKKYYNKHHNYNENNKRNNKNNNEHQEIIRTYEETHEHVEENSNLPQTYVNENRAAENYLNNAIEHQQQVQQIKNNEQQQTQQQERHDQHTLIDTEMESTHHHMTHEEAEDEIKEKIKIKHHHHHHHHNHVKEIIKKVPEPYPVEKIVRVPIEKIVEKIVHVPKPYPVEKIIHVPVEKIIEKIVHVPKPYPVEKIVHVPVEKLIEKRVPYAVEKIIEKIVHVPKPYAVEKVVNKVVHVPMPYPVVRKVPIPYRIEVERKVPIYMQHSGYYENEQEQQQHEHRNEQKQEQIEEKREREEEEQQHQHHKHSQIEEGQRDQYGYGSDIRGVQETIYGKPQTMAQIYAQLQQQNAKTKSAIRDILIKQQLQNLGYQKIPTEVQGESKNNYVMMTPQPSSTFKIHVDSEQKQQQEAADLQPQASNIQYIEPQQQPLNMPYQLIHIQAMPFQQPLGFSLPQKS